MMGKISSKIRKFCGDEKGAAVIEATFLYPSMLIMAIALLFMTIVVYQKAIVSYVAHTAADGIAYTWLNDTSNVGSEEGYRGKVTKYNTNGSDGLYWKLFEDNFITRDLFKITRPANTGAKLDMATGYYSAKYNAAITADLDGSGRVKVTATSSFKIPKILETFHIDSEVKTVAYAEWSDPVEGIRNVRVAFFVVDELRSQFKDLDKILKKIGL